MTTIPKIVLDRMTHAHVLTPRMNGAKHLPTNLHLMNVEKIECRFNLQKLPQIVETNSNRSELDTG